MSSEAIQLFTVTSTWAKINVYGVYQNDGNKDIYLQRGKESAPSPNSIGARIRPGELFSIEPDQEGITYLKTISGTCTISKYDDSRHNSTNTTVLVDPVTGNSPIINDLGQLHVVLMGNVDTENSTSEVLLANEQFIGNAVDTLDYAIINISVYSDVGSAIDGLSIQQSSDGENWDITDDYTINAGSGKTFSMQTACQFYRIVYTNGSSNQAEFRLNSILKKTNTKPSSHRISDSIINDDDAELVKAVITGERDDGAFSNATLSNSNRLKTVSQPYGYAVSENDIPGHIALFKFGTRTSVAAGVQSTVWEGPTALYVYLTSAQQLKVSSSSANDTALGTGARTLTLVGLDANYDEITEVVTMNGLSVVTTAESFSRIHRAYVTTSGTSYTNIGTITITNNAGTTIQCVIPANDGQTLMTIWTVPRGKKLYITQGSASTNSNKGARVSLFTRQLDGGTLYPWRIRYRAYLFSGNEQFPFNIPFVLPEKTDIQVRVTTPTSAGTTSFGATFEGWYESDGA